MKDIVSKLTTLLIMGAALAALAGCSSSTPTAAEDGADAPAAVAAQVASGAPTAVEHQACMLSGKIVMPGINEDVRDCMQTKLDMDRSKFEAACEGLANALAGTGNAPAQIDYMAACPAEGSQGSCMNLAGKGLDAFYYQRTDVAALPASCAMFGGTWVPAG